MPRIFVCSFRPVSPVQEKKVCHRSSLDPSEAEAAAVAVAAAAAVVADRSSGSRAQQQQDFPSFSRLLAFFFPSLFPVSVWRYASGQEGGREGGKDERAQQSTPFIKRPASETKCLQISFRKPKPTNKRMHKERQANQDGIIFRVKRRRRELA